MRSGATKNAKGQMGANLHQAASFEGVDESTVEKLWDHLIRRLGPGVQLIAYPDERLDPTVKRGDLIAVQPGIEPWPGDIVFAKDRVTGRIFGGTFAIGAGNEYLIRSTKPDRYADVNNTLAEVVAVVVARMSGRTGYKPLDYGNLV